MQLLMELSWRSYPAAIVIMAGLGMVIWGSWRHAADLQLPVSDPRQGRALARAPHPHGLGPGNGARRVAATRHV